MGEHQGHRKRMIEKMKQETLSERELLEVLLFNALPRRDTGDIAHRLLSAFSSLYGVFSAPIERLTEVDGVGENVATYLVTVGAIYWHVLKNYQEDYPKSFDYETFLCYAQNKYRDLDGEVLDVYFVGKTNRITGVCRFTDFQEKEVAVGLRVFAERLIRERPFAVALAHNHPTGFAFPSETDDVLTQRLQTVCATQNVRLFDHVVCSPTGAYSYYQDGRLAKILQRGINFEE
jgi:DNA repair protein RadC